MRGSGLIAHPTLRREILASTGRLRMQDGDGPALASLYRTISKQPGRQFSGYDDGSQSYFSVALLAGPERYFLTTMPREVLRQQAFASAQWVLWSGLASLALLLGFLATTRRRQIAHAYRHICETMLPVGQREGSCFAESAFLPGLNSLVSALPQAVLATLPVGGQK